MRRLRDTVQVKRSSRSLGWTESKPDSITCPSSEVVRLELPMCKLNLEREVLELDPLDRC